MNPTELERERLSRPRAPRHDESWNPDEEISENDAGQPAPEPYHDPEALQATAAWGASPITQELKDFLQGQERASFRKAGDAHGAYAGGFATGFLAACKVVHEWVTERANAVEAP